MKKLIITTCCIVTTCIITSFVVLPTIKSSSDSNTESASNTSSSLIYIVKNFNGNIAVYESGQDIPFKVTDVPVNSLSYTDQEIIKSGILVNSKTELVKILEDYCS